MTVHKFASEFNAVAIPAKPRLGLSVATPVQQVTCFAAGEEIYGQGDKATALYEVEFGAVRVYRLLSDGRRQIAAFHMAGEVFGFEADGTHHFFAEAIGATGVRVMRLGASAEISHKLLPLALQSLVRTQEHLLVLGRQHAIERVAAFLLDMAERRGGLAEFELPMSRMDIADYLGLTIETVSRAFTRLKEKGIVKLPGLRSVHIIRWQALDDMSA